MNMTKVAYLFGKLDLHYTCDKWVAAAHKGKPARSCSGPTALHSRQGGEPFFYWNSHKSQRITYNFENSK